ncbi:hypothetical protein NF867_11035, partial [Solitalea sp. MAHUQ-68]
MLLICFIFLGLATYGQSVGDYQSNVNTSGNWSALSSWQRWNGSAWVTPTSTEGYPGEKTGTGTVTILDGDHITLDVNVTKVFTALVIGPGSTGSSLLVDGDFSLSTSLVTINTGGEMKFSKNKSLTLPDPNAVLQLNGGTLDEDANCSNNVAIFISTRKYAVCTGGGNADFTFADLNKGNGTIASNPSYNSPACAGNNLQLNGAFTGANVIGTTTYPVSYNWSVTNPSGTITPYSTKDVTISSAVAGNYSAKLTVSFTIGSTTYSNFKTISVTVNALPTVSISGSSTICATGSTTLTPTTGGTWLSNNPSVATVTNAGVVSGVAAGSTTFTFTSSTTGCSSTTSAVSVYSAITGNTLPSGTTANCGLNTFINAGQPSGGYNSTYTYQWETSSDGTTWSTVPSSNTQGLSTGTLTSTTYFRRIVSSGNCATSVSNTIVYTITNTPFSSNTISINGPSVGCGMVAPWSLEGLQPTGGYNSTYTYQWQSSTTSASAGFTNIPGATGQQYSPGTLNQTTYFKRIAISGGCSFESNVLVLTVGTTTPAVPTITSTAATCSAAGNSTISNYNSTYTYTFSPSGPSVGTGGVISGMTAGTSYTVTASNGGCTSAPSSAFSNAAMLVTPAVPTITPTAATCSAAGSSTISNYVAGTT